MIAFLVARVTGPRRGDRLFDCGAAVFCRYERLCSNFYEQRVGIRSAVPIIVVGLLEAAARSPQDGNRLCLTFGAQHPDDRFNDVFVVCWETALA